MNPKLKDFLESKPNITLLGMFWSGLWRWYLLIVGVYLGLALIIGTLSLIFN